MNIHNDSAELPTSANPPTIDGPAVVVRQDPGRGLATGNAARLLYQDYNELVGGLVNYYL